MDTGSRAIRRWTAVETLFGVFLLFKKKKILLNGQGHWSNTVHEKVN